MKRILIVMLGAGLLVLLNGVYVVKEPEQVIITQFGEPVAHGGAEPELVLQVLIGHVVETRVLEELAPGVEHEALHARGLLMS